MHNFISFMSIFYAVPSFPPLVRYLEGATSTLLAPFLGKIRGNYIFNKIKCG